MKNLNTKSTGRASNKNFTKAIDILKGTAVIAHDRRKSDAIAIDYTVTYTAKENVVRPSYGVSNTMLTTLSALASSTKFVDGDGLPRFHFTR